MPNRTAILRFSDAEGYDTIALHAGIIELNGSTWWGWWKKTTEPNQLPFLSFLRKEARRGRLRVGLINRKEDQKLYAAQCTDVEFAAAGQRRPSPDGSLTPEYYKGNEFPAWFRFKRIEEIERRPFINDFGGTPSLDSTLYDVRRIGDSWEIYPRPHWSMNPIEVRSPVILHLSDLHFGGDHGFTLQRAAPGAGLDEMPLWQLISTYLTRDRDIEVGLVVISGDLITRGNEKDFSEVRVFISRLLEALNLETKHLVIVPGNHDIYVKDTEHPTHDYKDQEPYVGFVERLFRAEFSGEFTGLERARRYRAPNGDDLVL